MADTGVTVWAAGFWADDVWAAGFWSSQVPVEVQGPAYQPAGRKNRKPRYYVEIDGQTFHVEDVSHALAVLDHAADLAYKAATKEADGIASKIKKARRIGLAIPKITTDAPIDLKPFRERIRIAYKNAAIDAEMRMHMAFLSAQDEEAAALLLL